jgi:hypothetical protein
VYAREERESSSAVQVTHKTKLRELPRPLEIITPRRLPLQESPTQQEPVSFRSSRSHTALSQPLYIVPSGQGPRVRFHRLLYTIDVGICGTNISLYDRSRDGFSVNQRRHLVPGACLIGRHPYGLEIKRMTLAYYLLIARRHATFRSFAHLLTSPARPRIRSFLLKSIKSSTEGPLFNPYERALNETLQDLLHSDQGEQ